MSSTPDSEATFARPSLVGVLVATGAYLSVFYAVTDVVGGSGRLLALVGLALLAATLLGRRLSVRAGVLLSAILLGCGLTAYFFAVPESQRALFSGRRVVVDTAKLLTGFSVLRLTEAEAWALSLAPVPTFTTWYFVVRGRDVWAATVAGATLGFFVLTGDANLLTTSVGAAGVALAVGLRTIDVPGGFAHQWETVAVAVVAMLVLSATVSVVPGGAAERPVWLDGETPTAEGSLVSTEERIDVQGSIQLSPEVRFTVESESEAYWRTAGYDRYTGDGWVKTGEGREYEDRLEEPEGETETIAQRVTAETPMDALPAAWRPVRLIGPAAESARVSQFGDLEPGETVEAGDSYAVLSERPSASGDELRAAGTDYPEAVEAHYLQVPDSTPDRVGERTAEIVDEADAENPYDAAAAVKRHLQSEKRYSLTVRRPDGDVADAFLFEMDAGYCTYYATTMVVMLRTQGIPARFVTGYSPGERVSESKWVVRGQNAHAWVEVYFPEHGWVTFDPTPGDAYQDARDRRLAEARQSGQSGVDTEETEANAARAVPAEAQSGETPTPETVDSNFDGDPEVSPGGGSANDTGSSGPAPEPGGPGGAAGGIEGFGESSSGSASDGSDGERGIAAYLTRERAGYLAAILLGLGLGAHRLGYPRRAYRAAWVRVQLRRRDPASDVERAFARLERLLAARYRPRRTGETPRQYLAALADRGLDDRAREVGRAYERARYGGGVAREEADRAVAAVTAMAMEATPIVGRLFARRRD